MTRRNFIIVLIGILIGFKNRIASLFKRSGKLSEHELQMDEDLLG